MDGLFEESDSQDSQDDIDIDDDDDLGLRDDSMEIQVELGPSSPLPNSDHSNNVNVSWRLCFRQ
jgi:hypothetical protein